MTEKRKNKGNFPNLRFPGFEGKWEVNKLGDLLEFKNGINASKEQYGKGVKFINVLDILNNDFITYENIVGKVDVDTNIIERFSVQYGDILFQRSSETREEVGTANVYLDKTKNATFGGFVIRGRKIGDYNPIYFNKLLKTSSARDSITSKSGGSTRFNIGQEILSSIVLYFPSLLEQQKIASFLSLLDERILSQKKIIEELKLFKNTIVKKLFLQQLRFKNENGNDFPDWEVKKLEEIFYSEKGSGISKNKIIENGKYECVLYGELYTKYNEVISEVVSKTNIQEGIKSKIGDILIPSSTTTTGIDLANVTALNKENVLLGGDITVLRSNGKINNVFYAYYLSNHKKNEIASYAQGSTIVHLYYSHIKNMDIDFPCLEEQNKIADFLCSLDKKNNSENDLLAQYKKQKNYLLNNLFI